jgi:hypothetical protein
MLDGGNNINTPPQNKHRLKSLLICSVLFLQVLSSCSIEPQKHTPSLESMTDTPARFELVRTAIPSSTPQNFSGTNLPTPKGTLAIAPPTSTTMIVPSQESETAYLAAVLGGVKIVDEPDQLVFLSTNDEILWMIENRFRGLTFDQSGCYLMSGWFLDQYAELSKLSLKGQVLETKTITYSEQRKAPDGTFNFLPSPTGDFLAFMVGSGEGGRGPADWRFRDVSLIDFRDNQSSTPIMLTSNGGGSPHEPVWSSDGMYLAFSDFDENGIVQILVYGIEEGQVFPLTNFGDEMRDWRIDELAWSHDDAKVAFSAFKYTEDQSDPFYGILGVSSKSKSSLLWVSPPTNSSYDDLYWQPDNQRLMAARDHSGRIDLVFFDGETGEEKELLGPLRNEDDKSERKEIIRKFTWPHLLGYLYQTEDGIFIPWAGDILLLIREIILPAREPIDLSKCPPESFQ